MPVVTATAKPACWRNHTAAELAHRSLATEDDERWWSFGDGTLAALKTFQVSGCSGRQGLRWHGGLAGLGLARS